MKTCLYTQFKLLNMVLHQYKTLEFMSRKSVLFLDVIKILKTPLMKDIIVLLN